MSRRPNKLSLWFKYFTDESNPETFLNQTGSAIAAQYKCTSYMSFANVGLQNFKKLEDKICQWFEESGLSDNKLKAKLCSLLDAKKTVFQKTKGVVDQSKLPKNVHIVAETSSKGRQWEGEKGERVDDGETILGINVEDPEIQRKTLDMAFKVRKLYNDENSGNRQPINVNVAILSLSQATKLYFEVLQ